MSDFINPWDSNQETEEQVQPTKSWWSDIFDNAEAYAKAAYADTRQLGMGSDIKNLYDRIKNKDYSSLEERNALVNDFYQLQNEQNEYGNMFQENQKILNQNDSMLKDFTEIGGTMQGIWTQAKDTAIGAGTGAVIGSAVPVLGTGAGFSTGARVGNFVGSIHQAVNDADMNAIEAWKKVLQEGGNPDQAEQAYKDAFWNNMPTEALDIIKSMYIGGKLTGVTGKVLNRALGGRLAGTLTNGVDKVARFDIPAKIGTAVAQATGKSWAGQGVGIGLGMVGNAIEEGIQEPWQDYATERAIDIQRRQYDPTNSLNKDVRDFSVTGEGGLLDYYTTEEGMNTAIKAAKMGAAFGGVGGLLTKGEYTKLGTAHSDSIQAGKQQADWIEKHNILKDEGNLERYNHVKETMGNIYDLTDDEKADLSVEDVSRMYHEYYANKYGIGGNRQEQGAVTQADFLNEITGEETARRGLMGDTATKYIDEFSLRPDSETLQGIHDNQQVLSEEQVQEVLEQDEQQESEETTGTEDATPFQAKASKPNFFDNKTAEQAKNEKAQAQTENVIKKKKGIPDQFGNWKKIDENDDFDHDLNNIGAEAKFENTKTGRIAHIKRTKSGYQVQDITNPNEQTTVRNKKGQKKLLSFLKSSFANQKTAFQSDGSDGQVQQALPKGDGVISEINSNEITKDAEGNHWFNGKKIQSKDAYEVHSMQDLHDYYKNNKDKMSADLYAEISRQMMRFGIGSANNTSIVLDLSNSASEAGGFGSETVFRTDPNDPNSAIARAVVRLYAGADLATAAHEMAHLGWMNLSDQDRATFAKWATKTQGEFVAKVLGMNYDQNFRSYLIEALTNRESETSKALWNRIKREGAIQQTLGILNGQDTELAVEERFAWEFSNWYAQGYIKGSKPRNIIERILNKACATLQGALNLLSDTNRYLNGEDGYNGGEINSIFTNMSTERIGQPRQTVAPQVETVTRMDYAPEMGYDLAQGLPNVADSELGFNLDEEPEQNLSGNVGTTRVNPKTQKAQQQKMKTGYGDNVSNQETLEQYKERMKQEAEQKKEEKKQNYTPTPQYQPKERNRKVGGYEQTSPQGETLEQYRKREAEEAEKYKVPTSLKAFRKLLTIVKNRKEGWQRALQSLRQVDPNRFRSAKTQDGNNLWGVGEEYTNDGNDLWGEDIEREEARKKQQEELAKAQKEADKQRQRQEKEAEAQLKAERKSLDERAENIRKDAKAKLDKANKSINAKQKPSIEEMENQIQQAEDALAEYRQVSDKEKIIKDFSDKIQKLRDKLNSIKEETANKSTKEIADSLRPKEETVTETKETTEQTQEEQTKTKEEPVNKTDEEQEDEVSKRIKEEKDYYNKKEFEYNGKKYKYNPTSGNFSAIENGESTKISDDSVDHFVLDAMRLMDSPFYNEKKQVFTFEKVIEDLEEKERSAKFVVENTTQKAINNHDQMKEYMKNKNELQNKIANAKKTIDSLSGEYNTRSLQETVDYLNEELSEVDSNIYRFVEEQKEWRKYNQEAKRNIPKAIKILKAMYGQKKQTSPTVKKTKTQTQETTQQTQEELKEQVQKEETIGNNNKEWFEDMKPYFNGKNTSERVLSKTGDYRIVKRGYKVVDENGNPYGKVKYSYDVDQLGMEIDGEYGLESSFPTNDEAKKYLAEKVNSNTESNKSQAETPVQSSTVEQPTTTKSEPVVAENETTENEKNNKEQVQSIEKESTTTQDKTEEEAKAFEKEKEDAKNIIQKEFLDSYRGFLKDIKGDIKAFSKKYGITPSEEAREKYSKDSIETFLFFRDNFFDGHTQNDWEKSGIRKQVQWALRAERFFSSSERKNEPNFYYISKQNAKKIYKDFIAPEMAKENQQKEITKTKDSESKNITKTQNVETKTTTEAKPKTKKTTTKTQTSPKTKTATNSVNQAYQNLNKVLVGAENEVYKENQDVIDSWVRQLLQDINDNQKTAKRLGILQSVVKQGIIEKEVYDEIIRRVKNRNKPDTHMQEAGQTAENQTLLTPEKEAELEKLFWKLIRKKEFHGMDKRWNKDSLDYYRSLYNRMSGKDFNPEYVMEDKAFLTAIKNVNDYINKNYPQYKNLYRGVDGHWRFEFSDKDAHFLNGFEKLSGKTLDTTLEKILKHDNLYKFYSKLKEMPVHLIRNEEMQKQMEDTENNYYAMYDPNTKSIYINSDMFEKDDVRNSLLHEIQHAIQDIEGFANGTNDNELNNNYDFSEGEKQAVLTEKRSNMSDEELQNNPRYETLNPEEKTIMSEQRPVKKVAKSPDTKMQSNGQTNLGYIDKQKDIYSVTFTKSAQKNGENQKKIAFYRNNKSYWRENKDAQTGSITFTRALPYRQHQKTIIYDDINGKTVDKKKKTKVREYIEAAKDQIIKWLFNDKHFLKKAARNVGAIESYMRMMVMKDQGAVAGAAIEDGIVKHNGKNGERTKSLNSIIEAVGEEDQTEFLKYCEAFRVLDLEKRGIEQKMKPKDARDEIAKVQRSKNAKLFDEQRKNFVEYNHELLWVLVDGGFITEQQYDKFIQNDPNFIPLAKNMDELEAYVDGFKDSKTMINVQHPMHKIGTSMREVVNPFLEMQKRTVEYYVKASRNKAGLIFVHDIAEAIAQTAGGNVVAQNQGMIRKLASRDKNGKPISHDNKQYVFYVWENGQKQYYQVADREIYVALKSFDAEQMGALSKIMNQTAGRASRLVRNTATMTPDFGLRNLVRDNVEAFISSEHGFLPLVDSLWGMYQMANDTQWFREYQALNGEHMSLNRDGEDVATVEHDIKDNVKFYKSIVPLFKKDLHEFMDKKRSVPARLKSLLKLVALDILPLQALYKGNKRLNDYLETGTRIGEYRNARMGYRGLYGRLFEGKGNTIFTNDADLKMAQMDKMFAAYKAKDITLNFGQHGVLGKELNRYIPFFNASLQGIYKVCNTLENMVRADDTRLKQELWFKFVLMGAMGMAAALAGQGDDDYDEAPDYEHDNFWILPNGIRIPKDQLFGRLVGGTVEKATRQYLRDGDVKKLELLKDILGNFVIDKSVPVLVDLAWGTVGNYDSFKGRSVTPEYMADRWGYLQKDLSTSKIAADISEGLLNVFGFDVGAKKVDFVISKTLSNLGNYTKNLYELGTNSSERMTRGAEPEDKGGFAEWSKELPYPLNTVIGTFATNRNTFQSLSDFYNRYKELKKFESAPDRMSKAEKKVWEAYKKAYKDDKKYRDALKSIKQDKSLTGAQKRERADKIFKQQIRMARKLRDYEKKQGLI